jgi:molybdate transport system ATP-binding protein
MILEVRIRHRFDRFALDVDFTAPPGITVLFGRSGSGKTSIVNAVAGLLRPRAGRVVVGDTVLFDDALRIDLPPHRRRLGYIFQEDRLFPHLSVRRNLTYGRWFARRRTNGSKLDRVVEMLGIGGLLQRRPALLSVGEKQRVAIGRALLAEPGIILADEPLAALDERRKIEVLPYFERLRDEVSVPILYVSHSAAEVARLATTVVAVSDGRVVGQGPALQVLGDPQVTPLGVRAAGAVLETTVRRHHEDGLSELDAGEASLFLPRVPHPPGARIRVRVAAHEVLLSRRRPEDISALNILPGRVEEIHTGRGPGAIVSIQTRAGRLLARITRRSERALGLEPGVSCYAVIKTVAIAPEDIGG